MPTTQTKKEKTNITVVKKMRDYSNDPLFKKKAANAKAFLKKNGLLESLTKKK